jgi:AcrR family transcriptional regulator
MDDTHARDLAEEGTGPEQRGSWSVESPPPLGRRALQTREKILQTAKALFLERGYVGTSVNSITSACGISRAGFYTYFHDKRAIFDVLGETTYREMLDLVEQFEHLPRPASTDDLEVWVRRYFEYMDVHGPFILSSSSAPEGDDVREASNRMQMRVAWLLGVNMRTRQATPTRAPEALGLVMQAMLDRSWYHFRAQQLPVEEDDVVRAAVTFVASVLDA